MSTRIERSSPVDWEVLDPNAEYEEIVHTRAPRRPDLDGRKISSRADSHIKRLSGIQQYTKLIRSR